jgi:hypothetical protein
MATTQAWRELPTKGDKPKKLLEYFKVLKSLCKTFGSPIT